MLDRFIQPGLARTFILLLLVTVSASMIISLLFIYLERDRLDLGVLAERDNQRISTIITTMEDMDDTARNAIIKGVTTRLFQLALSDAPVVAQPPFSLNSERLVNQLTAFLPNHEILADQASPDGMEKRSRRMRLFSIKLNSDGKWVNVASRIKRSQAADDETLIVLMALSLIGIMFVGLYFIAQLVRPLSNIAAATRSAGSGNRAIRLSEEGPIELKNIAVAFNEMQDRISKFDAERNRTLAAVGHDLRTPITSLRIRAEMMDEDEAKDFIRILDEMTIMAESLITYSKGTFDHEVSETVDLVSIVKELCTERNISFESPGSIKVVGQPYALRRAFGNLLENAVRYANKASVDFFKEKDVVEIHITDDGPGIPEDKLETIFEPFVRVEESRDQNTGGYGLGLSIVKTIITAHGGTLELRNQTPNGLQVVVRLPYAT
ncbi:MAG: ATP-binding protein [Lentilitoribacter sp.]